jgi:hypothetical protein
MAAFACAVSFELFCEHRHAQRQPGFDFHALRGTPRRCSIHVNGPWGITFES